MTFVEPIACGRWILLIVERNMFGNTYRCSDCDFEFCSGWSHHSAGQHLVCRNCATYFTLGGGESVWGTHAGERLQFFAFDGEKENPTGVFVIVEENSLAFGKLQGIDGVSQVKFGQVDCPVCGVHDTMAQWFESGQKCPQCKNGSIVYSGACIY